MKVVVTLHRELSIAYRKSFLSYSVWEMWWKGTVYANERRGNQSYRRRRRSVTQDYQQGALDVMDRRIGGID